ncbi:MAG: alpha-2-macroglobulin family protein [Armatimonadota bacterium]
MKLLSRYLALVVMIGVCTLVVTNLMSAETPHGRVEGQLLTAETGARLAGVRVSLVRAGKSSRVATTETNAEGKFTFQHIAVGAYTLVAGTQAHKQPTNDIIVQEGKTAEAIFELEPSDPFLRVFQNQRVFTTSEKPAIRVHGFAPVQELSVRVYQVAPKVAIDHWQGWLPSGLTLHGENLQTANLDRVPELSFNNSVSQTITKRDIEGVFREDIPLGKRAPGMYLIDVEASRQRALSLIAVTDLGLIVKASSKQALVYAVNIASGEAFPGVALEARRGKESIGTGTTGKDGLTTLALPPADSYSQLQIIGRAGESIAVANTYVEGHGEHDALKVYTYTDRPVYRPGHTVNFKSIIRELRGDTYRVPKGLDTQVRVVDGSENVIYTGEHSANDFGTLNGEFTLVEDALPGMYTITISADGGSYETYFNVAEYRKPEFEVTVTPARKRYSRDETIQATISAQYYYGAPVPDAQVEYYVTRSQYWYYGEMEAWDEDLQEYGNPYDYGEGEIITSGNGKLDGSGRLSVSIPPKEEKEDASNAGMDDDWQYTVHAIVTDASKRAEEGSASTLVTQGDFRVDVSMEDGVTEPGQPVTATITAVDYDGKVVPGANGKLTLSRAEWRNGQEHLEAQQVQSWRAGADGKTTVRLTPKEQGDFRVTAETKDSHGNRITGRGWVWVMRDSAYSFNYPYQNMEVQADKNLYHEGDTATILVNTKFAPITALLTVEGDKVYEQRLVRLDAKSTQLKIKVKPEFLPAVHASVCFIKGKQLVSGDALINVSREKKALRITVTPDKPKYLPGERAVYRVKAVTPDGKPVRAEVSLGVVDESVYAIEPDKTPKIIPYFYPKRDLEVQTAFSFPEVYLSGDNKAGATIQTRRIFRDTAFWNPTAVTNGKGEASLSFTLPENLTTWRATVRAADMETHVGEATVKAIVSKPFLVRLEAPRFFTQGDEVKIAAVAHNLTDGTLSATVGLNAGGMDARGAKDQTFRIDAGKTRRVEWTVTAPYFGTAKVRVWAKAGDYTDAMELPLPVLPKGRPRVTRESGAVESRAEIPYEIRQDCIPGTQQLTLRLTPSLTSAMLGSLDYLAQYPYGCVEQTMSSFLPDVVIMQMLNQQGISNPKLKARLPKMVRAGLMKLYGFQHDDGGWGWWEYDDTDHWMTAYVVFGMLQAQQAGFTVNDRILQQGIEALTKLTAGQQGEMSLENRAFSAYVLALAGHQAQAAEAIKHFSGERGFALRNQMSDRGKAFLALAYKQMGQPDKGRTALREISLRFLQPGFTSTESDGWYGATEYAAIYLLAAVELTPEDSRLPDLVRWLLEQRRDNHWYSTRDTAFVLYALSDYLLATHELQPDMRASVLVNGKQVALRNFTKADLFTPEYAITLGPGDLPVGKGTITINRSGQGRLYYSVTASQVVGEDLTAPVRNSAGLTIERSYRKIVTGAKQNTGKGQGPIGKGQTTFRSGDIIEVTLVIRSQRALDHLMVEDMLPAGCEASDRGPIEPWEWSYYWVEQIVRDEKVAFALRNLSAGKQLITYRITAQQPGVYTALPPLIFDMYNPTVRGDGVGQVITIRP